jgi:hypothetical protein
MKAFAAVVSACLALALPVASPIPARAADAPPIKPAATSSSKDFDFLVGTWKVHNRRLKARHVKSSEWDEFPGDLTLRLILGGLGNVDEVAFPTKGWSGFTLRLFNPETRLWRIYWVNSRDGLMQEPVVGSFDGKVGEFFGDDTDDGKPIYVRYRWDATNPARPRWEQAFSLDRGKTWETNWTTDFTRVN